jgi:repressor LexA
VENGEIAAVLIDGEATLKRVRRYDGCLCLQPENPKYRPLMLWGEEMNQARILGKAVAFTADII